MEKITISDLQKKIEFISNSLDIKILKKDIPKYVWSYWNTIKRKKWDYNGTIFISDFLVYNIQFWKWDDLIWWFAYAGNSSQYELSWLENIRLEIRKS